MKKIIIFLFFLICCGIFFLALFEGMGENFPEVDKALYKFIAKEGRTLGKKYNMSLIGKGGGAKEKKLWLISMSFNRYDSYLSEEEARNLIIKCVDDCLQSINQDNELREFLYVYPFSPKNLNISIYNYKKDRGDIFYPNIFSFGCDEGEVHFFTQEEENEFAYKTKKYETFEEAVKILKKEKEHLPNTE